MGGPDTPPGMGLRDNHPLVAGALHRNRCMAAVFAAHGQECWQHGE